jgi:hypothetical protein
MQTALADALAQLDLKPGKAYRCQVKGQWVELRVLDNNPPGLAKPYSEADVMLDPWVELPGPAAAVKVTAKAGKPPPFDIPYIPEDAPQP